jgi:signal transduction histidine kinase
MTAAIARFQSEAARRERLTSLGRLSTVIAHEIRNPLMIVKTAVRTLRQADVSAEEKREGLSDIEAQVARLNRLVDDVLDFARPIRFEHAHADLNELCRRAAAALAAGEPGPETRLLLAPELPALWTDSERLQGVLLNVLTNARQAALARGDRAQGAASDIELRTLKLQNERVAVVVRDFGVGIPAEDLPRVFEPYFTTKRGGTGLGLAIAKNVVEGLGGTLTIESRSDEGTQVRIELPTLPAEPLEARA